MSEKSTQEKPLANTEAEPSSARLIATLGIAGFFSGLVLVGVYLFTLPMIQANRAQATERAIYQVLPGSKSFQALVLKDGALAPAEEAPSGKSGEVPPRIFAGFDEGGKLVGFAIPSDEPGFQDIIGGIFGYDPEKHAIIGFEVLDSKETPGLGDKIIKDPAFRENFRELAIAPQIISVKKGEKQAPNEVEAITGATISSKAVVRLLQKGVEKWQPAIEQYVKAQKQ